MGSHQKKIAAAGGSGSSDVVVTAFVDPLGKGMTHSPFKDMGQSAGLSVPSAFPLVQTLAKIVLDTKT